MGGDQQPLVALFGNDGADLFFDAIQGFIPANRLEFAFAFFTGTQQRLSQALGVIDPFGTADTAQTAFHVEVFACLDLHQTILPDIGRQVAVQTLHRAG